MNDDRGSGEARRSPADVGPLSGGLSALPYQTGMVTRRISENPDGRRAEPPGECPTRRIPTCRTAHRPRPRMEGPAVHQPSSRRAERARRSRGPGRFPPLADQRPAEAQLLDPSLLLGWRGGSICGSAGGFVLRHRSRRRRPTTSCRSPFRSGRPAAARAIGRCRFRHSARLTPRTSATSTRRSSPTRFRINSTRSARMRRISMPSGTGQSRRPTIRSM